MHFKQHNKPLRETSVHYLALKCKFCQGLGSYKEAYSLCLRNSDFHGACYARQGSQSIESSGRDKTLHFFIVSVDLKCYFNFLK